MRQLPQFYRRPLRKKTLNLAITKSLDEIEEFPELKGKKAKIDKLLRVEYRKHFDEHPDDQDEAFGFIVGFRSAMFYVRHLQSNRGLRRK